MKNSIILQSLGLTTLSLLVMPSLANTVKPQDAFLRK